MKWLDWHNCYRENAKAYITPESFAHPAKMSTSLCKRIYDFMQHHRMISPGDTIVDPFGGVGITAIVGAGKGYQVITLELEEKFYQLTVANFSKHKRLWEATGVLFPLALKGDSRKLSEYIQEAGALLTSPPFTPHQGGAKGINTKGYKGEGKKLDANIGKRSYQGTSGKRSKGNTENLKEGDVQAVITSPPYAEIRMDGGTPEMQNGNMKPYSGEKADAWRTTRDQTNIGNLPEGKIDGIVTSPPYEEGIGHRSKKPTKASIEKKIHNWGCQYSQDQKNNIGNQKGETYWQAMLQVYSECYKILKPGGWAAVVVKDFVRNKQRVPLCDNTVKLLEHVGFRCKYRARAHLTIDHGTRDMFHGGTKKTSRKSFFRRLAEKNGSPPIDFEEVIFVQKGKRTT